MHLKAPRVLLLSMWVLVGCAALQPGIMTDRDGWVIHRAFLLHRQHPSQQMEIFWTTPVGAGPWPAGLFIHGHQGPFGDGGEAFVRAGRVVLLS